MTNIFDTYTDFITTDPRTLRPGNEFGSYNINSEFQYGRHLITLPPSLVNGKTVLDLGSCLGASGAWVLHHGAKKYVGVEIQNHFCDVSTKNLQKHFPNSNWEIKNQSLTDFFKTNEERFDIVIAFGILYQSIHFEKLLENITKLNSDLIIVESAQQRLIDIVMKQHGIFNPELIRRVKKLPLVEYKNYHMLSEKTGSMLKIEAAIPNIQALEIVMLSYGYQLLKDHTDEIQNKFVNNFDGRYSCSFVKYENKPDYVWPTLEESYNRKNKLLSKFGTAGDPHWTFDRYKTGNWKFDYRIAPTFQSHAEKHIPKYYEIIEQSVNICDKLLNKESKIIDIGCAIGETIKSLKKKGFNNLIGVDSSQDMLDNFYDKKSCELICSDRLPEGKYDAILCNWTLHFIQNKKDYLKTMFDSLNENGFIILTEKTKNSGVELQLYHDFKESVGVTKDEIQLKSDLIKNSMFIDDVKWYFDCFDELGVKSYSIINASPCFTTFFIEK